MSSHRYLSKQTALVMLFLSFLIQATAQSDKDQADKKFWNSPAFATSYRPELSPEEKTAGLSKLWSEVKYNFVNFDLVPHLDWDSLYMAYSELNSEIVNSHLYCLVNYIRLS